jgi:hypothetical protein
MKDLYVGYRETKTLLVPASALPPLTRCDLVLTAKGAGEEPINWLKGLDPLKGEPVPPWWMTRRNSDHRRPTWTGAPGWTGDATREPRCGDSDGRVTVKVSVPVRDVEGPVLVHAFLDDGHEKNDFLIPAADGAIDVGRDVCGGAFDLAERRKYRLTLSAMDAAGNETPAPGKLSTLTAP